jgi:hypothetical protein
METVTQIREEIAEVEPRRWLRIPDAVRSRGIGRSKLYDLIRHGKVRSACLRDEANSRGTRLINAASLDAYITKHEGVWSETPDNGGAE